MLLVVNFIRIEGDGELGLLRVMATLALDKLNDGVIEETHTKAARLEGEDEKP